MCVAKPSRRKPENGCSRRHDHTLPISSKLPQIEINSTHSQRTKPQESGSPISTHPTAIIPQALFLPLLAQTINQSTSSPIQRPNLRHHRRSYLATANATSTANKHAAGVYVHAALQSRPTLSTRCAGTRCHRVKKGREAAD